MMVIGCAMPVLAVDVVAEKIDWHRQPAHGEAIWLDAGGAR